MIVGIGYSKTNGREKGWFMLLLLSLGNGRWARLFMCLFLRPASRNVDISPEEPHFEKNIEKEINHNTQTEQLARPNTTAIVPFEPVNEGKAANSVTTSLPALAWVIAIEFLWGISPVMPW